MRKTKRDARSNSNCHLSVSVSVPFLPTLFGSSAHLATTRMYFYGLMIKYAAGCCSAFLVANKSTYTLASHSYSSSSSFASTTNDFEYVIKFQCPPACPVPTFSSFSCPPALRLSRDRKAHHDFCKWRLDRAQK